MRARAALMLLLALFLGTVAALLGVIVVVAVVANFLYSLRHGYFAGGKEDVMLFVVPVVAFFFFRWTREAWSAWRQLQKQP